MLFHPFGFTHTQQLQLGWRCWQPALPLRPWLECYYLLHPQAGSQAHRLYPDGGSTLTLQLGGTGHAAQLAHSNRFSSRAWQGGDIPSVSVRFKPGGLFALFGVAMAELKQETAGCISQVLPLQTLADQLPAAGHAMAEVLDCFFLQQLQLHTPTTGAVQFWLQAGLQAQQEIRQMLHSKGVVRRKLERQFQLQVGMSAGQLHQWQRLKQARYLLRTMPQQSLSDIACSVGYYDQAYFTRHFSQHCGQSPGQYRQRKLSQLYNTA